MKITTFGLFLTILFPPSSGKAIVLEELIRTGKLQETFSNKVIGYYIGSFDPPHLGHQDTADIALDKQYVDYVLIYPNWGGDAYKRRSPIQERLKMLFALFKDHPRVIVTALPPQEMQRALTVADSRRSLDGQPTVKPAFNMRFIGLIGSDAALELLTPANTPQKEKERRAYLNIFMRGIRVSAPYACHTMGGLIALPVNSFIVSMRQGDVLQHQRRYFKVIGDRPIGATFSPAHNNVSSQLIKDNLKKDQPIAHMVDQRVLQLLQESRLSLLD